MPSGIKFTVATDANVAGALPKFSQVFKLRRHFGFVAHNSDIVLHRLLEIALQRIGIFACASLKWAQCFTGDVLNISAIDIAGLIFLRELGGELTGAFSEN